MRNRIILLAILILCPLRMTAETVRPDSLGRGVGVATNPAKLLQGLVSGVQVSATDGGAVGITSTRIRGVNTVRGISEPLWVVDGAILTSAAGGTCQPFQQYGDRGFVSDVSQMEGWNLDDIASIEVLKNTAATAIYGTRGANGVVIITTRRPPEGNFSKEVRTHIGVNIPTVSGERIRPGLTHNHSIALGASAGRTRYRFSAFWRDAQGGVAGEDNNAFGARAMFETQANGVVWFGLNTSLSISRGASRTGAAWYGAPSEMLSLRGIAPLSYYDSDGVTSIKGWAEDYDDDSRVFRTTDNFWLTLNLAQNFRWITSFSFDMQDNSRYIWYGNGTAFGAEENGAAGVTYESLFTMDIKSELKWNRYFGAHHLNLAGAYEYVADWNKANILSGSNFFMHDLRAKGLNLKESKTRIRYFPKSLGSNGGHVHFSYDYAGLTGVDLVGKYETVSRYDSGSPFGDNLYPAATLWTDLKKMLSLGDGLSRFRLEGGWGKAGRRHYVPYEMLSASTSGGYPDVDTDFQAFYEGYDRVETMEGNVTLHIAGLDERVSLSAGVYDRRTEDKLTLYCFGELDSNKNGIWRKTSRQTVTEQASTIANTGVELELWLRSAKDAALHWEVALNGAFNRNNLDEVSDNDTQGLLLDSYGLSATRNVEGHPVSSLWGYTLDDSNTVTGEGLLGDTVPKFTGGLDAIVSKKRVRMEMTAYSAAGFKILNMNRMLASGEESVSEAFVERGDYLRLGRLTISYNVPAKLRWISRMDVSLTGTNLLTLSGYSGWNPEVNSFSYAGRGLGIDYGSHLPLRTVMLGVSLKF